MIDIKFLRENPDIVKENIKNKFQDKKLPLVDEVIELDKKSREVTKKDDDLRAQRNSLSDQIGGLMREGKKDEAEQIKAQVKDINSQLDENEKLESEYAEEIKKRMMLIPNIMDKSVPIGKDDSENVENEKFGDPVVPEYEIPHHADIIAKYDGLDKESAGRTSGEGFYYLTGDIARLHSAMLSYARDFMIDKGLTYETEDGIYFDTSKFPKYADFARLDIDNLQAGARVEFNSEKRNVSDFAIWKWVRPNEDHAMKWRFLDRDGYPGWHLECATIIHVTLGQPIDIHTGGIDHIPVHHTNEIAEAEAAFDKPLANYWLHCNHVTSDGKKISKSLGNGYSLDDLEKKGYTGLDYKMWVLQGNYQAERNFSFDDLKAAAARLKNYKNWVVLRYQMKAEDDSGLIELKNRMMNHLTNNLNSAGALAELDKAMNVLVPNDEFVEFLDEIFGLDFLKIQDIDDKTREKIAARNAAKNNKKYDVADKIRDELAKDGIKLEDRADMILWQLL